MSSSPLIAGFGEIMLRLSPDGKLRLTQVLPGSLRATFGGGEANVCVSIARLGMGSRFLTALPKNPVADSLITELRGIGVDTTRILRTDGGRVGIYYAETGANQRGSSVVYDELPASFVPTVPGQYDYAQTLISGNVSRGSIYVKIAASESDLTREEASIPSIMIPQTTDDGIAEDLLLYFAIALASLLFLEWLLQVKENY